MSHSLHSPLHVQPTGIQQEKESTLGRWRDATLLRLYIASTQLKWVFVVYFGAQEIAQEKARKTVAPYRQKDN